MDPLDQFKAQQKITWAGFGVLEGLTGMSAPDLVRHARIRAGQDVLDVGCGTGVVGLAAARLGARVTGADLTPELVAQAKDNATLAGVAATFVEADAEALPFADASFDAVVSQFGHMFAPRPDVTTKEMLRVLRPGGTIAFATWPPEHFVGRSFALMGRYAPPPPAGVSPPATWGDPAVVRERLGDAVRDLTFSRGTMWLPALSPAHYRRFMENGFGPAQKLLAHLTATDAAKADALRGEIEALAAEYFEDHRVRQDFLLTRAIKR